MTSRPLGTIPFARRWARHSWPTASQLRPRRCSGRISRTTRATAGPSSVCGRASMPRGLRQPRRGRVYYPYGGGIAKVIGEAIPNVEATAEVTAASVDNLKFLRAGKSDLAFTLADTLDDALKGQAAFREFGKVPALSLAALYTNYT